MRVPRAAGFRLHVGETGARRRIRNANEVLAGRALNLAAGVAGIARQWLITMGTIEFEFVRAHKLHSDHAPTAGKNIAEIYSYFQPGPCVCKIMVQS